MTPILEIKKLYKSFGGLEAPKDITFNIQRGEIIGLVGPNGAGKTTTINILCTLLYPTSGSASIAGYDCKNESADERKS